MRKIVILIFIFNSFIVISQGNFGKSTPQVADFIRYGEIPVSLFHGQMSLEVPIYHYKDRDFNIPIQLAYTAEGFKPSKRSDLVGLDWTLIAAGCITREIYGFPDDAKQEQEYGYYLGVKRGGYDKEKIWDFDPSVVRSYKVNGYSSYYYLFAKNSYYYVDYQPDLFLFNFNGHSGHFMIDDNGTAISTNKGYKIDISNLKEQNLELNYLDTSSSITITTPEGYTYEFGGSESRLEYSINFKDNHNLNHEKLQPKILAWHLSKITAPNGRVVTFNYVEPENNLLNDVNNPLWQSSEIEAVRDDAGNVIAGVFSGTATKKSVLASIEIENVRIEFNTSKEKTLENSPYNNRFHTHNDYNSPIYQLDNISVKYKNNLEFTYDLLYENFKERRFLKKVILNDGSKYTFTYNHTTYPPPGQSENGEAADIYGFWKKNDSVSSYGLMSRVVYPTGGYSDFHYEKHEFSKEVEFNAVDVKQMEKLLIDSVNMFQDTIYHTDNTGTILPPGQQSDTFPPIPPSHEHNITINTKYRHNGSRISKIVHYTATYEKAFEKTYIYKTKINGDKSSGILYQSPPIIKLNGGKKIYAKGSIWLKNYNIDEPAIGYSDVFELYSDLSYCKYSFYDWYDNPDNIGNDDVKFKFIKEGFTPTELDNMNLILTGHSRVASYSDHRGRLKSKFYYTPDSTSAELTEHFDYLNMRRAGTDVIMYPTPQDDHGAPETQREYVVAFLSMEGGGMAKKIYLDKYHPVTRHYTINKDGVRTLNETLFNDYHLPKTENTILESGDTLRNNFYYPFDYTGVPYSLMKLHNQISPIVEQVKYRIKNKNFTEVERLKVNYAVKENLFLPANKQVFVGGNFLREVISYDRYDNKGNILQTTGLDGITTAYIWSGDGHYLLAEVLNATYEQVKNIPISNLRTQLPHAQVTTYTYKPLVGMISKTDPRGVTTYYKYDGFGRLIEIRENNENGRIIQRFDYHYKSNFIPIIL